ncbi:24306_t:CDS:2 [Entrophospora sp. SA101]|nr:11345_t:CDS:2 [Entrophospora sp. SA101]CAJ0641974.1 8550_t:CDS:2 [Entrophospora sp. SA101]CAJ0756464.1 17336_t:CDS:2 [Entrophospora sp. SA101]CAJ0758570.1 24306_t:CDS:2 [Entrophospora sp. SA101]CAJ0909900.1 10326_t:CDS:2 [Entrophospora sp. SA101]
MIENITEIIHNPDYHDVLAIVKGFRNGAVYGAKVRFPHALVMTLLFRSESLKDKLILIFKATKQHSKNLAFFVTTYKTMMYLQKLIVGKEQNGHSFIAGLIGGYLVFGENNNVNQQIVLYVFARIMIGLAKLPVSHKVMNEPNNSFPIFAALVWGTVMWLFRHNRDVLQPSLQSSMQYLYLDSDKWNSLKTFLWHNK